MTEDTDSTPDEGDNVEPAEVESHATVDDPDELRHLKDEEVPNHDGNMPPEHQGGQGMGPGGGMNAAGLAALAQQAGGGNGSAKNDNLEQHDLDVLIGHHIRTNLVQNELGGDVPDDLKEVITISAARGALQALNFVQGQLYGDLDKNAQNIVFENTITDPIKQEMIEELRKRNQQQAEQNNRSPRSR